jgi:hypothetical protein
MANHGVTMVYSFQYRGNPEEWSQQYHFTGSPPSDHAGWVDLVNGLQTILKDCTTDRVHFERAYCYTNTDNDSVTTVEAAELSTGTTGTLSTSSVPVAPGDAAIWMRWKTSRTNTHGHAVYLRKYFHSVILSGETDDTQDSVASTQVSAMTTSAGQIRDGLGDWPGLAGPAGDETFLSTGVSSFATTRTLKRRGRRP